LRVGVGGGLVGVAGAGLGGGEGLAAVAGVPGVRRRGELELDVRAEDRGREELGGVVGVVGHGGLDGEPVGDGCDLGVLGRDLEALELVGDGVGEVVGGVADGGAGAVEEAPAGPGVGGVQGAGAVFVGGDA